VKWIEGLDAEGQLRQVLLAPESSPAANYAFDVTPVRFVRGLFTERGICRAQKEDVSELYLEKRYNQF